MGCSTSRILLKQGPPPLSRSAEKSNEDRTTFLTADQRDAIRETWRLIHAKGALNVSKRIFLFIFQLKPEAKSYFPFRGVWGDELFAHPQFRDHVTRFVSTIDAVVDNVNNIEDEMGTKLRTLGETHARGTVIDGAYFDVFVQAIITVLRQELMAEFSARMNFAWIRLLGYVAHQMKEGYRDAMALLEKSAVDSASVHDESDNAFNRNEAADSAH